MTKKKPDAHLLSNKIEELKDLHSQGLKDREIAKILGFHHRSVGSQLKKLGLETNGPKKSPIEMVDEFNARCSKCFKVKAVTEFQLMRRQQKYEYRLSYCNECRKEQANKNLRSNILIFIGDRVNRLKLRCAKNNVPMEITKFDIVEQLDRQKYKCFYSDIIIDWSKIDKLRFDCLSIDKIIPELGYIRGNVVLTVNRINTIKYDCTLEEIRAWMPFWYNRIIKHFNNSGVKFEDGYLIFPNGSKHPHKKLKGH